MKLSVNFKKNVIFKNLEFKDNYAAFGATYIYLEKKPLIDDKTIIEEKNRVKFFGTKGISYPRRLRLKIGEDYYSSNEKTLNNVQTGGVIKNNTLNFELLDENNEIIPFSNSIITVFIEKPTDLSEKNKIYSLTVKEKRIPFNNISKSYLIPDLHVVGSIGKVAKLIFETESIKYTKKNSVRFFNDYQFSLEIKFRDCIMGKYINILKNIKKIIKFCIKGEIFEEDDNICLECGPGTYSLTTGYKNSLICKSCPNFQSCPGGKHINITGGYWRINNETDLIEKCIHQPLNCIGGISQEICATGHIGALCESCDLYGIKNKDRYSKSNKYRLLLLYYFFFLSNFNLKIIII